MQFRVCNYHFNHFICIATLFECVINSLIFVFYTIDEVVNLSTIFLSPKIKIYRNSQVSNVFYRPSLLQSFLFVRFF